MPIQATASRGMLSTRTARRAHMTELTRVGLTCRAFARAGSKGGSHDRAHMGAGSHAGHSLDAAGVPDVRPHAILVHCLGSEGQRIFASLTDTGSYAGAVTALSTHFGLMRNVMMERYRFRQRGQRPGETVLQYVASLKELASTCNFGELHEEMIRDQLIEKTCTPRIRERLLMEPDTLTLDRTVTLAGQIEAAIREARTFSGLTSPTSSQLRQLTREGTSVPADVQGVHYHEDHRRHTQQGTHKKASRPTYPGAKRPDYQQSSCSNCGSQGHKAWSNGCPAKNQTCHECGRRGHFAHKCRSSGQVRHVAQGDDHDTDVTIYSITENRSDTFKNCQVKIDGKTVNLLMDLGAKVSIVSELLHKELFAKHPLTTATKRLYAYNKDPIPVLGMVHLPNVQYGGHMLESFPFYVTKQGTSLMGIDLFNALGFHVTHKGALVHTVDTLNTGTNQEATRFPTVEKYAHCPNIDQSVSPVSQKLRRLPLSVRPEVSAELKRLEEAGIIEKIDSSPWISNLVVARQKNNEIRLCVDLRAVNKAVIPDKYPLPTLEELTSEFHGSTVFSKLDLRRSYLQVPLTKDARHLSAFITHDGVFQYTWMCYGLASAPSAFQKILSSILSGCKGSTHLLDDVVEHGKTQHDHDRHLTEVLERFNTHNLLLNDGKCQFSQHSIDFAGYTVSAQGVIPLGSNVKAINDLPVPKDVKGLQSFLGTTNFYLKFVPRYAEIAEPLHKLLRKGMPWSWTREHTDAFEALKRKIAAPPTLAHFDPGAQTYVPTDASSHALGAVLSQSDGHTERPVAFASRTLSPTERKYSTSEREALAAIFACEHWHLYLYGRKFHLHTDHAALKALLSTAGSGHKPLRIYRWADRLLQYT